MFEIVGTPKLQMINFFQIEDLKNTYEELKIKRKSFVTKATMAYLYRRLPLYITDAFDIRLRLYPVEHWISRVSGSFKHLLCESSPIKLTKSGLIHILLNYYKNSSILDKFNLFLNTNPSEKKIYNFFHSHYIDFSKCKDSLYFINIHLNLLIAEKTGKTSLMLELDQVASGVVFYLLY